MPLIETATLVHITIAATVSVGVLAAAFYHLGRR